MRSTLVSLAAAAALLSLSRNAHAQLVVGYKYQFNDPVVADSGRAPWSKFEAVGSSGGEPENCASSSPATVGLPDNVSYAPSSTQRRTEIYLWYEPSKGLSRAQVIRHEQPLPVREAAGSRELVTNPITSLTGHTIFLVDYSDSTITAYNRRENAAQRGVAARISDVVTLPLVKETLGQIDEARRLCRMVTSAK